MTGCFLQSFLRSNLTSTPIPVPDRMASNTNPWAVGTATLVNGGILALMLLMGVRAVVFSDPVFKSDSTFHIDDFPLFAPAKSESSNGGQGGGMNDLVDPNKGRLPKLDLNAVEKVQVPLLDHPKLALENSIAIPPRHQASRHECHDGDSPNDTVCLRHRANTRTGFGLQWPESGPASGSGWGPGPGAGIYHPALVGVSQPIPIFTPEAEFSDEARRQKYEGVCVISVIIDAQGNPQSPRVVRRLGMGLDEKALRAVMKYRFKPAKKDGKPVAVRISVMVDFRLF